MTSMAASTMQGERLLSGGGRAAPGAEHRAAALAPASIPIIAVDFALPGIVALLWLEGRIVGRIAA